MSSPSPSPSLYDPLPHLNELFRLPQNLDELPQLLSHTASYKQDLTATILNDVAKYNQCYVDMRNDTAQLAEAISTVKSSASSTQRSITAMTSSIQSLDNYKKNLVLTMTIVKRLQMLLSANSALTAAIPSHNYHEILQLLGVIKQLLVYFKPYRSIDEINSINLMIVNTQNKLVDDIFNDFEEPGAQNGSNPDPESSGPNLLYGCQILELIDSKYKDKLLNLFYNNQLKDIKMIFNISEEAGSLENLNRRFIYFKNTLSTVQAKYLKVFPTDWKIDLEVSKIFCKITSQDIMDLLRRSNSNFDSKKLMDNLFATLEFEKFLNDRFKTDEFNHIISSAFEPYLKVYIQEQERALNSKLMESLGVSQLPSELIGDKEEDFLTTLKINNVPNISNSSIELFKSFYKVLNQMLKLSTGEILIDLSRLFNNTLRDYHNRILLPIVPQREEDLRVGGIESLKYLTMLLNTGDYVISNIVELQEKLEHHIQPQYKSRISFEDTKDIYFKLINKAITNLLLKISLDLKPAWRIFENMNWSNLTAAGNEEDIIVSAYLVEIRNTLVLNLRIISPLIIRDSYIRNFDDKLIELLINLFGNHLRYIKSLNINTREQVLKDLASLKELAFVFPLFSDSHFEPGALRDSTGTGKEENGSSRMAPAFQKSSKSYQNLVTREFGILESVIKVLTTPALPIEDLIEKYFELIGDKSLKNFTKVLSLKSIEKHEQKKYIENFKLQLTLENSRLIELCTLLANIESEEEERIRVSTSSSNTPKAMTPDIKSPKILPTTINNFEKNLRELALNSENHVSKLNENFKNFGKLFRKDND
ncbi:protein required for protein sorting at the late Golgi [Suhomyces tanzawaensis NRRL Y-17324]|uniref:Protein required for protein sorting at the late Golgi n=1 Tax=Suhomyces tanzawaensis NRRL Y-17324 TaxID=984487 RepID=A0A1E4SBD6_9ASCO|nr:protein required for protein sorting at the late Golgi [Suhomyces tanzawaensis NRRL Y-17324]ODV76824.1 protein required for protein sorting at the late Golgi [Suhomyces tanzawaensis NRRL Y-17324]